MLGKCCSWTKGQNGDIDYSYLLALSDPDSTYEEDMQILRVIEAYCTTNRRQTQALLGKLMTMNRYS